MSAKEEKEREIESLNTQLETKKNEILLSKKELEFIETELSTIGRNYDTRKIIEAAGAIAASINVKYEDQKRIRDSKSGSWTNKRRI